MYIDLKEAEENNKSPEKPNSFPTISDGDLFVKARDMRYPFEMRAAVEELIARYESAKRDLNDYSEI